MRKGNMYLSSNIKNEKHKNWFIRGCALIITALCVVNLQDMGEPRPYHISIPRGIINSLLLNGALWLTSFKTIRLKFKLPIVILLFISALGVFIATPFSRILATIFVIFYFWVIYDLLKTRGEK